MTQFQASLIAAGDPEPLPTTVQLDEGKLSIESNGQTLGDWRVDELDFERIVGGFRVTLDGEVAVLKLAESDQFNAELGALTGAKPEKEPRKSRKKEKAAKTSEVASVAVAQPAAPSRTVSRAKEQESKPSTTTKPTEVGWLDEKLEVASKKWERYLPDWVFTRGGVAVATVALIAILIFRPIFATIFLIVAAIGLITSAIALLDQVIATRIFRGGFTPIHGLLGSLFLVLISLLLAAL